MRRVLLDQGFAPRTASLLRQEGWEALHVSEAGLDRAEDQEILAFARQGGWVCATFDHDFHAHLALTQSGQPSVVFVRLEGLDTEAQVELIRSVWRVCAEALARGAAVSVDGPSVRIRELPLR